ncbi:GTP cyclohydrolase FolE2 [Domibacillus enclensis]|uniref:GTP cyclohydrolase FolE2 n=1 Tax=Domibacillus enclensis TaxID=1017273 RepID=A0A1N6V868_9BACI|nr:GTP cyclohydrolase FolE2 [Domibacillus enclensis]OXS78718.1 GTP cyclohydrolase FolE2 [Domibacillus enclensis]SIQ73919.1 GTP cyclohydrolase I [Domibacillus enclensis]
MNNLKLPSKRERLKLFGSSEPGIKLKPSEKEKIPDLQNKKENFLFEIDAVGITNVKMPVSITSVLNPYTQTTIASFTLTSAISHEVKGTNMSRFTEQLELYRRQGFTLSFSQLSDFLKELAGRLEQKDASLEVTFPWFYEQAAPVSSLAGLNHADARISVSYRQGKIVERRVELSCAVTTLCPCSKEISEYSAHNQRGYIRMMASLSVEYQESTDWKAVLLEAAQSNASAWIYPILKRPDEKAVTEKAYENPRFVEDMVRLVAADLYEVPFIESFTVECRNEESIHLHDAYASLTIQKNGN